MKGQASPGTDGRGARDREGSPRKADINSELSSSLEDMLLRYVCERERSTSTCTCGVGYIDNLKFNTLLQLSFA